jgi:hypothetical protein
MTVKIDPAQLGTLDLEGLWAPYIDLADEEFLPARVTIGDDEYAFESSVIVKGHGAVLPGKIRQLRGAGKKPVIAERADRYYVFVSPP